MREPDPEIKPPTHEERRETVEFFALQALFRWPNLAREVELSASCFRGNASRAALGKAALDARFLTPQGSVPVATTAAAANVPLDVAMAMLTVGFLPDPAAGRQYLRELVDLEKSFLLRKAIEAAVRDSQPEELYDAVQSVMLDHLRRNSGRSAGALPTIGQLGLDYIAAREALAASGQESALPFGPTLPRLTKALRGGHHRCEVTTLMAGAKVGKTTFARYLQVQLALRGIYSLDFSGEMHEDQQGERYVHAVAGVAMAERLQPHDLHRAGESIRDSDAAQRILVDARPYLTPDHMLTTIQMCQARYGDLGLVVVDHMGKVEDRRKFDDRDEWVKFKAAVVALKEIAMICKVPILAIYHMKPGAGKDVDSTWTPKDSDGRGGGSLVNECDTQLAIWRSGHSTFVQVMNCRQNGEAAGTKIEMRYNAPLQSFAEVETLDFR